jgi:hypothetical protein
MPARGAGAGSCTSVAVVARSDGSRAGMSTARAVTTGRAGVAAGCGCTARCSAACCRMLGVNGCDDDGVAAV